MDGTQNEVVLLADHRRIDATDKTVAVQDRKHVVAIFTSICWDVDFDTEIEVEHEAGPLAIADQVVERRQERRARLPVACLDSIEEREILRVDEPVPRPRS